MYNYARLYECTAQCSQCRYNIYAIISPHLCAYSKDASSRAFSVVWIVCARAQCTAEADNLNLCTFEVSLWHLALHYADDRRHNKVNACLVYMISLTSCRENTAVYFLLIFHVELKRENWLVHTFILIASFYFAKVT